METDGNAGFAGKHIVITGASSGIGRAGALRLAADGARLTLTGTRADRLEALREEIPDATVVVNDAAQPLAGQELARAITGDVDGLWLNAGRATVAPIEAVDAEAFDELMSVNVRGPFLHLAALAPRLRDGAAVVVTSSTSAHEGTAGTSLYAAGKAALIAAAQCWASELAPRSIRVNTLVPGATQTDFRAFMPNSARIAFEHNVLSSVPLGRVGSPEEVAAVAAFLLSDDSGYVTGGQYVVDGGLLRR